MDFPVTKLREQFPALSRVVNNKIPLFLDGPAGTQVPQSVIDAITHYLTTCNANHAGAFTTSRESDRIIAAAHQATADFLNASSAEEIIFGQNMTSLTFHFSRSLAKTWSPGDEIIVTRLDHDANVRPWTLAAQDVGATVHYVDFHPENGTLNWEDYQAKLSSKTKLVAIGAASNLLGTINDVAKLTQAARQHGAKVFVDAVHYAPHGPIDVQAWDCDFLACSAYKFFGPHVGILWGRQQLLEELQPYKVRPASDQCPDRWMTGTQNHEGLAGVKAALDYLSGIGMDTVQQYERGLSAKMLEHFARRPDLTVRGITDPDQLEWRVPTFAFTSVRHSPQTMAQHLADHEIYAWAGHSYAIEVTERLDLEKSGGVLRVGLVHYNTVSEIDRLFAALDELP